ncbi:VOC family protein [Bacillus sp. H-16]|uniref:VOC family protein n=1 Tax=Alteribacter salitolerans TaxID=2912333 RepID=UPI001962E777|nr:VOC family protein [Alteribacter salitolerans]MBM7095410.1 VOC family protein [Alteribacter salitolerans]
MESAIQKVGQIGIPVQEIERAVRFYKEKLGLPLLFSTGSMAFFDCEGLRLMLTMPEKKAFDHPSSVIYFTVKDIRKAYEDLQQKSVVFIDEPHLVAKMGDTETWMTFFKDGEGNTHAFISEVKAK